MNPTPGHWLCSVVDVPLAVVQSWEARGSYINQGELLVGPLIAYTYAELIQARDIIWFLDNTSAISSLIKGASSIEDSCQLAMRAQMCFMALRCRVWFEHVGTKQNPSDGLSRDGLDDPWVRSRIAAGVWSVLPCRAYDWDRISRAPLNEVWDSIEALGDAA